MSIFNDASNIFKVLDSENNGYITVDTFITSFHNFYQNNDHDKSTHENTLKSLIAKMEPDKDGRISFDNFLLVFQQIQPEKSFDLKSRRYSQYSLKRFLSAESFEIPLDEPDTGEHDNRDVDVTTQNNGPCLISTDLIDSVQERPSPWEARLSNGHQRNSRFLEFDDITNHSTWPKRKLRYET